MRPRLDATEVAVELEEDVLRDLFAAVTVSEEMPGDAEDHRLVVADQRGERVAVAPFGPPQRLLGLADFREQCAHSEGIYVRFQETTEGRSVELPKSAAASTSRPARGRGRRVARPGPCVPGGRSSRSRSGRARSLSRCRSH